jgi:ABC-2 type transport system ATP-binding protein
VNDSVIVKIRGLSKDYASGPFWAKEKNLAVDSLDLDVVRGEIFGLLGPNGAGKTTTLNMIIGVCQPSAGTIELFGKKFSSGDVAPLRRIGYVPETTFLPDYFTVTELLDFYARLFRMSRRLIRERIKHWLESFGLTKVRHALLKNLSMGQRRLVDFIQAFIHEPDLILLDEPTVYLDPLILDHFRSVLWEFKKQERTIIMSSHMISEIERLSDRVAVLDNGRCLKVGPKEDFLKDGGMEKDFLRLIRHENQ